MNFRKIFIRSFITLLLFVLFPLNIYASNIAEPVIYSPSVILMHSSTGKILYEKNAYEKMYPASTTKIMTAILTLENCNLYDTATVSYDAVMTVPVGYSHANLQIGETLTIEQLLNVLLIPSANDAANVLAEHIGGSVESFCTMMNTKALEIGCQNTNFVNPSGIHNDNHYSTAYDLALIGQYAMKNDTFRSIVKKTSCSLPSTDKYSGTDRIFKTTNELIIEDNSTRPTNYSYEYAIGIKTGYTTPAKNCIVAGALRDNLEFISVILGATQTDTGLSQRYLDAKTLFNYGFDNYTIRKVKEKDSVLKQTTISNGTRDTRDLDLVLENGITVLIKQEDIDKTLLPEVKLSDNLSAPITKGTVVGTLSYTIEDITYTTNLLAGNDVKESKMLSTILKLILILFLFWFVRKCIRYSKKKKNSYNKKRKNYRIKK